MKYLDYEPSKNDHLLDLQVIKQANLKRVFDLIRHTKVTSRANIAKKLKLSPTTISSLVECLVRLGYVRYVGIGDSTTGRKPVLFEINPNGMQIPVISFKPTGLQYYLYDCALNPIESLFVPYPETIQPIFVRGDSPVKYRNIDGNIYVEMVVDLIQNKSALLDSKKIEVICLTLSGTFSWEDGAFSSSVLQVKAPSEFVNRIKDRLGVSILVGNESASLAYAEKCLIGQDFKNLIFVNICFGVGAGIIIDGKLFTGAGGLAGEMGHISINYNGRTCFCGNKGCLERYVSQNAIIDSILNSIQNGTESLVSEICDGNYQNISFDMLRVAYEKGDKLVHKILEIAAKRLVLGLSNMVCALSCYNIVLGGGIENLGLPFLNLVQYCIKRLGFRKGMDKVKVRYTKTQCNAECLGVSEYFFDNFFKIIE